jgi:sigma-B regulation protein RsbU (phosphoserine phosphatase)
VDSGLLLAASNGIVRHLKVVQKTAPLFFDDVRNWIHSIHPIEQAPLKVAQTEVLVPFFGKDKLLGVLALGRRKAETPYTKRDLKLLDEIALQAGVALENSHLAVQLAQELSADEKLERQAATT